MKTKRGDDPVAELIGAATNNGRDGAPDAQAARVALDAAAATEDPPADAPASAPGTPAPAPAVAPDGAPRRPGRPRHPAGEVRDHAAERRRRKRPGRRASSTAAPLDAHNGASSRPIITATRAELAARLAESERALSQARDSLAAARVMGDAETVARLENVMGMLFEGAFGFVSQYRGAHWKLPAEDSAQLGHAWAPVVAPYADIVTENGPIIVAVLATLAIVRPRLTRDAELEALAGAETGSLVPVDPGAQAPAAA